MTTLTEIAEYVEQVLMLDLETPIMGYDGTDIGPSNQQAQALANRTKFLKERGDKLEKDLLALQNQPFVISINKVSGEITITPESINAAEAVHTHVPADIETGDDAQFVTAKEKSTWNDKQTKLVSGKTIKTISGDTLLGEGDIVITANKIETSDTAQFVSKDEKATWNGKQEVLKSGTNIKSINKNSLLGSGEITLTYTDVGADKMGTAATAVSDHIAATDPHQQYLTKENASTTYVNVNTANKPNGYLQLDEYAKIPSSIADLFSAVYVVVGSTEERLKLKERGDIIICLQTDNNTVYYLNANLDPSVEDNWDAGQSTAVTTIISVFGRSGIITAKKGDYSADLITETDSLTFVHEEDRKNWNGKQDALETTKTIKTINGLDVLGSGDIAITPESIGAAEKIHTHDASEIKTNDDAEFVTAKEKSTWNAKQNTLQSAVDVKTLNGKDLVGKGNLNLIPGDIGAADADHKHNAADISTDDNHLFVTSAEKSTWNKKQDALKSGASIKTINKDSLLGEGDISITPETIGAAKVSHTHAAADITTDSTHQFVSQTDINLWTGKQDKLVDNKNIKTVFGKSLLGTTDLRVSDDDTFNKTVFDTLKPGTGTKITLDDDTGLIEIGRDADDVASNVYTVVNYTGLLAKQGVRIADPALANITNDDDSISKIVVHAYRKKSIYADPNSVIDYKNPTGMIKKTPEENLNYDGIGYATGESGTVAYSKIAPAPSNERYISNPYTYDQFPTGTQLLSVTTPDTLEEVVPAFPETVSSNDMTVGGITAISSTSRGNQYYAGNAYRKPAVDGITIDVDIGNYWSSNAYFNRASSEVFLGFTSQNPVAVTVYGFQQFTQFAWGDVTTITGWKLQARNSSNVDWTTIDTQTGQNLRNGGTGWTLYRINTPVQYSQYRILVTSVEVPSAYTAILRLQFYTRSGVLIKDKNDKYLTVANSGAITEVTLNSAASFNTYKFRNTPNLFDIESIKDRFPIRFCTYGSEYTEIKPYKRVNKIFMQDPLNNESFWYGLSNLKALTYSDDFAANDIRVALTIDGGQHRVYSGGNWISIGTLTTDDASASTLLLRGMTLATLATITKSQWATLLGLVENPRLGIAFARSTINTARTPMPLTMSATVDENPGWQLKSINDVKVTLNSSYITFTADEAGDYKFCYRLK